MRVSATRRYPLYMVLPAFLVLFLLTIYPFGYMLWISLHKWPILPTLPRDYVGTGQYEFIFDSPTFWDSLTVTVIYMAFSVTIQILLGLFLAHLLNTPHRMARFFRLPFIIPVFVSPVVVGLIWRMMLGYDLGILNYFLRAFGLDGVNWLGDAVNALISLIIIDVWQWTPFTILILRAGLDSMAREPFESAAIDGASRFQMFYYVTLPMISPILTVALLFRLLDAFKLFDIVYVVTRGGPGAATNVLAYNIWRKGFFENQLGYAAALSVIMIVIATVLASVLVRIMARHQDEA
ncbi:MAG: sugar ABC transporter permease [Hyphomicrobiales bacterium]|nr:sugar ABC transporter permease [Hyphomicrobiales bacterium]